DSLEEIFLDSRQVQSGAVGSFTGLHLASIGAQRRLGGAARVERGREVSRTGTTQHDNGNLRLASRIEGFFETCRGQAPNAASAGVADNRLGSQSLSNAFENSNGLPLRLRRRVVAKLVINVIGVRA